MGDRRKNQKEGKTYTLHSRGFFRCQIDLHNFPTHEPFSVIPIFVIISTRTEKLQQRFRVLGDELAELRVLPGELLDQGLDQGRVFLHRLYRSAMK